MENSSKALIIAGSILIAILLISVGVIIMNSTGNTQQTVQDFALSTEARTFNSQLTPYEGQKQSAAQVRSLVSTVNAMKAADSSHSITISYPSGVTNAAGLTDTKKYNVALTYGTDGYVSGVTITE